jgi:fumarate hydratase class II
MANSFDYIVKTRNRCIVRTFLDVNQGMTFGITGSAFSYTDLPNGDTQITPSSASLSRIVYGGAAVGAGGNISLMLRYGTTGSVVPNPIMYVSGNNAIDLNFERLTLPNNSLTADGTFVVTLQAASGGSAAAYLEFVPF